MTDSWYYVRDGHQVGPLSRAQLVTELLRSPFWQREPVWKPGYAAWREAGSVDELSSAVAESHLAHLAQSRSARDARPEEQHHERLQDQLHAPRRREASVRTIVLIYAGLAVLGIVGAVIYHAMS